MIPEQYIFIFEELKSNYPRFGLMFIDKKQRTILARSKTRKTIESFYYKYKENLEKKILLSPDKSA